MNQNIVVWVKRLQHADAKIRRDAIRELELIGDPDALIPLAELYANDPDTEVRELAQKSGKAIYFAQLRKAQVGTGASDEEKRRATEIMKKAQAQKLKKR